ncbi:DNA-binding domain-containing protein [Sandarakinorhabdus sp. AAP62]|uniref:HvfC/BufC N-terminal domain-containing protein n=1 Tax=Sandarakinorhabdus sp. AAP62 TaxID=1248916 RepID=UPI00031628BB|nr:DNA-binding domain-containing protein [Sandarakinorhabdus sp. AAP62]
MTLARFQRQFQAGLIAGDLGALADAVERPAGLAVHTHAARAMLVDGLADNFAKTLHWLGGEAFTALALAYAAISPSSSWTLADYGDDFPEYLRRQQPDEREVAELAALDWALRSAFAAADPQPATWAQDPDIDWEALRLKLAPGTSLLAFATNADAIWAAIPAQPITAAMAPGLVLVWRDRLEPRFRRTSAGEGELLAALAAGQRFGPACDASGADSLAIGAWLREWLSAGLVVPRG